MLRSRYLHWLSEEERTRLGQLRTRASQAVFLGAHVLLRGALSYYVDVAPGAWTFSTGIHGKPRIARPTAFKALHFNLSHTDRWAVVVVSRVGPVGVDVERTSRNVAIMRVARHFLSKEEQVRLGKLSQDERAQRFFRQWVAREAYLKGTGKGLGIADERLTLRFDSLKRPTPIGAWRFSLHNPDQEHLAAAAVRHHERTPITMRWLEGHKLFR
ncbi:MAG TPA: 4'-phosphopantetheinyl transferase superfamily protein [Candidatus Acidoferrales bacterium]|nr:4'-phosphopantetheinyl transferase superfamily protein [Candidatus Acidoferrales bacterium]